MPGYPDIPQIKKQLDIANDYTKLTMIANDLEMMGAATNSIGSATAAFLDSGFDWKDPMPYRPRQGRD